MESLIYGFKVALDVQNLFYCFIGTFLGTLVGILPGLGPAATIAILLPATFALGPTQAIIMLAGIYYGAMYGGSTTSILVNIPGEASSVVTCLEGYQLARKGRAGAALFIVAIGSFIAGTFAVIMLTFLAPRLSSIVLTFGPSEYFALMFLGLVFVLSLSTGSHAKSIVMAAIGFLFGLVGLDPVSGVQRFTFGKLTLLEGVGFVPVAMGIFGISEVIVNAIQEEKTEIYVKKIGRLMPGRSDWVLARWPIVRGSILGFFVGLLPGGGAVVSSFLSYALEKRISKRPAEFGCGSIAGLAGPESANNSAAIGAFIPMLTMGIPANAVIALMLAALLIHGITPGPMLVAQHPDLFWGVIASMYIGNVILLILNLPLIWVFVQVLRVPYRLLGPLIILFCVVGAYSLNNNPYDILIMVVAGLAGIAFRIYGFDPAPLILSMVIAPMMEMALRQGLMAVYGNMWNFFFTPTASLIWGAICLVVFSPVLGSIVYKYTAVRNNR